MSILNWIKVAFFAILAGMFITIRVLVRKNEKLKYTVEKTEKQLKLKVEQNKIKAKAVKNEKERIEEIKDSGGSDRADRLNRVLDDRGP